MGEALSWDSFFGCFEIPCQGPAPALARPSSPPAIATHVPEVCVRERGAAANLWRASLTPTERVNDPPPINSKRLKVTQRAAALTLQNADGKGCRCCDG